MNQSREETQVLILASGNLDDQFYSAGFESPKFLIKINNEPLFLHCARNLLVNSKSLKIAVHKDFYLNSIEVTKSSNSLQNAIDFIPVPHTYGATCTALLSGERVEENKPVIIAPADILLEKEILGSFLNDCLSRDSDVGLISTRGFDDRWSYLQFDSNSNLTRISPKIAISDIRAVGIYFYKDWKTFMKLGEYALINFANEKYPYQLSQTVVSATILGLKVTDYRINENQIVSLASPGDLRKYLQKPF